MNLKKSIQFHGRRCNLFNTLIRVSVGGGGAFKMAKGSAFLELEVKIIKIVVMLNYLLSENIAMLNIY